MTRIAAAYWRLHAALRAVLVFVALVAVGLLIDISRVRSHTLTAGYLAAVIASFGMWASAEKRRRRG